MPNGSITFEGQRSLADSLQSVKEMYRAKKNLETSVWMDGTKHDMRSTLKKPKIMLADLNYVTRNGKLEEGFSPFDKQEFIRLDGAKYQTKTNEVN